MHFLAHWSLENPSIDNCSETFFDLETWNQTHSQRINRRSRLFSRTFTRSAMLIPHSWQLLAVVSKDEEYMWIQWLVLWSSTASPAKMPEILSITAKFENYFTSILSSFLPTIRICVFDFYSCGCRLKLCNNLTVTTTKLSMVSDWMRDNSKSNLDETKIVQNSLDSFGIEIRSPRKRVSIF